jgi:hypothetical protein
MREHKHFDKDQITEAL